MPFENWDEFMTIKTAITSNDLLVVISARKLGPSYQTSFEKLPTQLSSFQENSFIVLYPEQFKEGEVDQMQIQLQNYLGLNGSHRRANH